MSNVIQFSITGDTNAEQVAGRAKAAVSGLDKQLEGISKRFGSSFKDIFLSFLGPMALLGTAMGFIGKMIADNQKRHDDASKSAIDNTNALMSAEDKYYQNKLDKEKNARATKKEAKLERAIVTEEFLYSDPRGKEILDRLAADGLGIRLHRNMEAYSFSTNPKVQAEVQALIAEDIKKNPAAMAGKDSTFSGPQGFSNVIGVGANPVLENLTRQTDIQQQILEHLKTTGPSSGITDVDFTKMNPTLKVTA
jgi:hypothetical protein